MKVMLGLNLVSSKPANKDGITELFGQKIIVSKFDYVKLSVTKSISFLKN